MNCHCWKTYVLQDVAAVEAELNLPPTPAAPRSRAGRQTLPEHLERVEVRHEPDSCTCSACQSDLVKIGEDISEQLDIEPARFFVIRHIRRLVADGGFAVGIIVDYIGIRIWHRSADKYAVVKPFIRLLSDWFRYMVDVGGITVQY